MNPSWRNNYGSGFVYFNINNSSENVNTPDYLGFNESPTCNKFSPAHYSSPNKFQKSPRNYHGKQKGRNSFRYHNSRESNSYNSPNRSFNSTNYNNSWKSSGRQNKSNSFNNSNKRDISVYFDYTSTKDPWAELERNLKETQEAEEKVHLGITEKESSDVEESFSGSADEQESESEVKTSSSEAEEPAT